MNQNMNFAEKVYLLCQQIPKGKVTTYKAIAEALGSKGYRAVGQALRCNPSAPTVPCHRVVSSNGSIGGYQGEIQGWKIQKKIRLLEKETVTIYHNKIDLGKYLFKPPTSPLTHHSASREDQR